MSIYSDIATRTNGDIYIGVVGPVRTGKSTFIKKFMETLVIPNIRNEYDKKRAKDEMPQSAAGKTVMTTEPKFIPDEAVEISLDGGASLFVKMIDCVGYIVPEALGGEENNKPRMVMTPWSDESMPFEEAAEMGTGKVIKEHSTIGVLVTSDGSFGEFSRENYEDSERKVANELKAINKPFVIILNSATPEAQSSVNLALEMEKEYGAPVALVNCLDLDANDIKHILELVLLEFPITEVSIRLPDFMDALDEDNYIRKSVYEAIISCAAKIEKTGDVKEAFAPARENEYIAEIKSDKIDLATGAAELSVIPAKGLFYKIIGDMTGINIADDGALMSTLIELSKTQKAYDKIKAALASVNETGYGVVTPDIGDMTLEEPEVVKQSGGYAVKLRATAPSIHMIKANIAAEVSPVVGTEQQSENLVRFLLGEFEKAPGKIWETNIFGRSLYDLMSEGLSGKLANVPEDAREKLSKTLERVINEGSGGLLCIIL